MCCWCLPRLCLCVLIILCRMYCTWCIWVLKGWRINCQLLGCMGRRSRAVERRDNVYAGRTLTCVLELIAVHPGEWRCSSARQYCAVLSAHFSSFANLIYSVSVLDNFKGQSPKRKKALPTQTDKRSWSRGNQQPFNFPRLTM